MLNPIDTNCCFFFAGPKHLIFWLSKNKPIDWKGNSTLKHIWGHIYTYITQALLGVKVTPEVLSVKMKFPFPKEHLHISLASISVLTKLIVHIVTIDKLAHATTQLAKVSQSEAE